jgi:excinuclease ABC subunit B
MQRAIDETNRRRDIQEAYNKEHNITPRTIEKAIRHGIDAELKARRTAREMIHASEELYDVNETLRQLEEEMLEAATNLEFEKAAAIRDRIKEIKSKDPTPVPDDPLTAAIATSMSNRLAGNNKPTMTPQQKKVRRGPKHNRG